MAKGAVANKPTREGSGFAFVVLLIITPLAVLVIEHYDIIRAWF